MSSLIERLLAAHRMLSGELRRERGRSHPNAARIARLKAERLAIKDRVGRHLPRKASAATLFRSIFVQLLRRHRS